MTLTQWTKPLRLVAALAIAIFSSQAAFAELTMPTMDGGLPFYPKAVFRQNASLNGHSEASATWAQLWAKGFPTGVFSRDDVAAVDRWYRLHLHAYTRRSKGAHAAYMGPGGTVTMFPTAGTKFAPYGKTLILLNPQTR